MGLPENDPLLSVRHLTQEFFVRGRRIGRQVRFNAVDDVSFDLSHGETLALVGESGSGKTTLAHSLLGLHRPSSGHVRFAGRDVFSASGANRRLIRRQMQVVFQDPAGSLNPRMRIGDIVAEPLRIHHVARGAALRRKVGHLLERVGLNSDQLGRFPHELSGGQRQRVAIVRAIALEPKLVICDEPVSALDVSIQAQIMNLLVDLQRDLGMAYLFIAHNLAVVRHLADRVAVMYRGRIVESGLTAELFQHPAHPYTAALLAAVPKLRVPHHAHATEPRSGL